MNTHNLFSHTQLYYIYSKESQYALFIAEIKNWSRLRSHCMGHDNMILWFWLNHWCLFPYGIPFKALWKTVNFSALWMIISGLLNNLAKQCFFLFFFGGVPSSLNGEYLASLCLCFTLWMLNYFPNSKSYRGYYHLFLCRANKMH